jgi:hypothetical protein
MSNRKARIRAELFKSAVAGEFPSYGDFRDRLWPGLQGWRREWSDDLNTIAIEETKNGYPDITYILRRSDPKSPYPSQIDFRDAHNPDAQQLDILRKGTDEIISLYCPPGTKNPY